MSNNRHFSFETGQATNVGCVRQINEDNLLSRPDFGLWVVADGMGGHAAGDFASMTIVRELNSIGVAGSAGDLQVRFMERLERANELIAGHAADLDQGTIGSTVVSLLIHGCNYACIWSGDSRAYLLRDGMLTQQSEDHTEVRALLRAGSISEAEAANWPRKNVITRAIGVGERPDCDIVSGELQVGDRFVLCSDGLTEHLADDEIARCVAAQPPQQACDAMIAETLQRGGRDNVTVIVIRCHPQAEDHALRGGDTLDDLA